MAQDGTNTREERETIRTRRAEAAAQIDVMYADDAQLREALERLNEDVRGQQALAADALRAIGIAEEEANEAEAAVAAKAAEVNENRSRLAVLAVDSYINPPGERLMDQFHASDAQRAAEKSVLITSRVGRLSDVIDQLREAERQLDDGRKRAERLRADAEQRSRDADKQLEKLVEAQARQQNLVVEAEKRLDAKLAEAAYLESYDKELSAKLLAEQEALSGALRKAAATSGTPLNQAPSSASGSGAIEVPIGGAGATTTTEPKTSTPTPSNPGSTVPEPSTPTPSTPTPSTPTPSTPTPSTPTPSTPPTTIPSPPITPPSSVPLTTVGGITVNTAIAERLGAMLAAAREDGINLGGGGYRDPSRQIQLRRQNCGTSDYAIYQMPPSACTPPTARPGTSNHERGLAIDFTYNGGSMASRSNPGYLWLVANAARFGFYNLPSEPWHWSVDGH